MPESGPKTASPPRAERHAPPAAPVHAASTGERVSAGASAGVTVAPRLGSRDARRPVWFGHLPHGRLRWSHDAQYVAKRFLDLAGAAVITILFLPLMLLIAIAIKLTSRGPVLYRSPRLGLAGHEFECLKFRTMYVGADARQGELEHANEATGPLFKMVRDPRVTRVGGFLRKTALDELPQLLNILRSEMSLVGPRPLPLRDCARLAPFEHRRHAVRPGMTGLWQVSPERHAPDGAPIVALDLEYVDNWSLWLDVKIVLRTVAVVLRGDADASEPVGGQPPES